jgi:hypothetical protein
MEITSELGPIAKKAHYLVETGIQVAKVWFVYQVSGEPAAALGVLAWEVPKIIPSIPIQSAADLKIRDWYQKQKRLKELDTIPGIKKISVVSSSDLVFKGLLAQTMKSRGAVFIETDMPLDNVKDIPNWNEKWGRPVAIANPEKTTLKFKLKVKDTASPVEWNPSLKDVLEGKGIPDEVVEQWKKEITLQTSTVDESKYQKIKAFVIKHLSHAQPEDLKIDAILIGENGATTNLGTMAQGSNVKRILGQTVVSKAMKIIRRDSTNSIPITRHITPTPRECSSFFLNFHWK